MGLRSVIFLKKNHEAQVTSCLWWNDIFLTFLIKLISICIFVWPNNKHHPVGGDKIHECANSTAFHSQLWEETRMPLWEAHRLLQWFQVPHLNHSAFSKLMISSSCCMFSPRSLSFFLFSCKAVSHQPAILSSFTTEIQKKSFCWGGLEGNTK